jgi:hypothetical protein
MSDGISRRGLIGAAGAYFLCPTLASAAPQQDINASSPDPFVIGSPTVVSRTITRFLAGLGDGDGYSPPRWFSGWAFHLPEDAPFTDLATERKQAEFFASFAVGVVAPHYLRSASYCDLAAACEADTDIQATQHSAAVAQHHIGRVGRARSDRAGHPVYRPQRELMAYGAAAHASTAGFYALLEEENAFPDAGYFAARSLAEGFSYDDPVEANPAETAWLWEIALLAIKCATRIPDGHT